MSSILWRRFRLVPDSDWRFGSPPFPQKLLPTEAPEEPEALDEILSDVQKHIIPGEFTSAPPEIQY